MKYIMVARHYSTVQRKIAGIKTWWTEAGGLEVAHTAYQGSKWGEPRRLTVVRQKIQERPKAKGKQLKLFQDDGMHGNYRYSCYTHLDYSAKIVWDMYKGRADCENRIKEIKQDFGFDSSNLHDFAATEAALNFTSIAYNIMALFKQAVLKSDKIPQLKTLHYKIFAIGGYITKNGNQKLL